MTPIIDTHHALATLDTTGIATLTLRNAKALNIVGTAAILELTAAMEALKNRGDVKVLILRGSGDNAFVGGADMGLSTHMANNAQTDILQARAGAGVQ
jgi:enoyl-CoA hydratase/carnithine racemase